MKSSYYSVLGLQEGATPTEVKKAYFSLIRKFSPETDPEGFQRIREAYEQLKDGGSAEERPKFTIPKEKLATQMVQQCEEALKKRRFALCRDTAQEGVGLFPEADVFLFYLAHAQRLAGNTGKAVKSAEKLVERQPDNKFYQRELALACYDRGYVNKAVPVFEKAYALGVRDRDFILTYGYLCDLQLMFETGVNILYSYLSENRQWTKETMPELSQMFQGLGVMTDWDTEKAAEASFVLYRDYVSRYAVLMREEWIEFTTIAATMLRRSDRFAFATGVFDEICHAFQAAAVDPDEKETLNHMKVYISFIRFREDERIGETLKDTLDAYQEQEEEIRRFAIVDMHLCLIAERDELLPQIRIMREEYPEIFQQMGDFLEALERNDNPEYLHKKQMQTFLRLKPYYTSVFYRKHPEERERIEGKKLSDGLNEEPFIHEAVKIRPNDKCPCGSGKKYKQCCMRKH